MKFRALFIPSVLAMTPLVLILLSGCASTNHSVRSPILAPKVIQRSTVPYVMAPLDEVRLTMKDKSVETLQISPDGTLLIQGESRQVKGMPAEQFRSLMQKRYPGAQEIVLNEFRPNQIAVLGEVFHQIHTDLGDGPMRVMDALASANGFTPLANKKRVKLIRQNAGEVVVYELDLREMMMGSDIGQNILLEPGDTLTVPRNFL